MTFQRRFTNAGILTPSTPVRGATAGDWNTYFTGNFGGAMRLQQKRVAKIDRSLDAITEPEDAMKFAGASCALKGMIVPPAGQVIEHGLVEDDLTTDELIALLNDSYSAGVNDGESIQD